MSATNSEKAVCFWKYGVLGSLLLGIAGIVITAVLIFALFCSSDYFDNWHVAAIAVVIVLSIQILVTYEMKHLSLASERRLGDGNGIRMFFNGLMVSQLIGILLFIGGIALWWAINYSELFERGAFRKEVETAITQSQFDQFSPFGVPLTNTCEALHITDRKTIDFVYRRSSLTRNRRCEDYWQPVSVDRGYLVTDLQMNDSTEWLQNIVFQRNFASDEHRARVEYEVLRRQILHKVGTRPSDYSYATPFGTVSADFLTMKYNGRLIRYFPRLMHLTDITPSMWCVELHIDTFPQDK